MIHPQAIVDSDCVGHGTTVWAFAHVVSGARIGNNVKIGNHAYVEGGAVIGNNVTLKNNVCVWEGITIEDDVFVGPNVTFTNDKYPRSPRMPAAKKRYESTRNWLARTTVRQGCSVGANATILPGLELGAYSMIAAGAVVTRDVAPFTLVAGTPAMQRANVCTCGQILAGDYDSTTCHECGETAEVRIRRLKRRIEKPVTT